jgi:hypothetical protein
MWPRVISLSIGINEHGSEVMKPIKSREYIDRLSDCQFLKNESIP